MTGHSKTFKFMNFGTNRKPVYNFVLVNNSNCGPGLHVSEIHKIIDFFYPIPFNDPDAAFPYDREDDS